jgi:hypothetical protein
MLRVDQPFWWFLRCRNEVVPTVRVDEEELTHGTIRHLVANGKNFELGTFVTGTRRDVGFG